MARNRTRLTEKKIEQLIREGRGQGEGAGYIPWIKVGEFSSKGRDHRLLGIKTGRMHHFFSDLEAKYYYQLEWADDVTDIREQFPLFPVSDTERIAAELKVIHPKAVASGINNVMTTDFLLTIQKENAVTLEARSIKYKSDLKNDRTRDKQKIEREYWAERGVVWKLATEDSISTTKVDNIKKLLNYYSPPLTNVLNSNQLEALAKDWIAVLAVATFPNEDLAFVISLIRKDAKSSE